MWTNREAPSNSSPKIPCSLSTRYPGSRHEYAIVYWPINSSPMKSSSKITNRINAISTKNVKFVSSKSNSQVWKRKKAMKIGNQSHAHTNIPETRKALARLLIWQIELTGNSQTKLARFVKNWIPTAVVNRSCTMLSTIRSGAKHLDQDVRVNDNALTKKKDYYGSVKLMMGYLGSRTAWFG